MRKFNLRFMWCILLWIMVLLIALIVLNYNDVISALLFRVFTVMMLFFLTFGFIVSFFLPIENREVDEKSKKLYNQNRRGEKMELKLGKYRHYKGNEYRVLAVAKHSETLEPLVVYQALYGEGAIWVRPLSMWFDKIETPQGTVLRFTFIEE